MDYSKWTNEIYHYDVLEYSIQFLYG
jgi:hypothetical protein